MLVRVADLVPVCRAMVSDVFAVMAAPAAWLMLPVADVKETLLAETIPPIIRFSPAPVVVTERFPEDDDEALSVTLPPLAESLKVIEPLDVRVRLVAVVGLAAEIVMPATPALSVTEGALNVPVVVMLLAASEALSVNEVVAELAARKIAPLVVSVILVVPPPAVLRTAELIIIGMTPEPMLPLAAFTARVPPELLIDPVPVIPVAALNVPPAVKLTVPSI